MELGQADDHLWCWVYNSLLICLAIGCLAVGPGAGSVAGALVRSLYYRDSYGRVHRDRPAERRTSGGSGVPARFFVTTLMVLAAIVVLASMIR